MSTFVRRCRVCGSEFAPYVDAIGIGTWRLCPDCRMASPAPSRCRECGKSLAGTRDVCLDCMGVGL
jgi:hypothetical protein